MLQGYLEELRKTSLLEPEEELELWRRDAAGDEAAPAVGFQNCVGLQAA